MIVFRALYVLLLAGFTFWNRLLGPGRAKRFLIGGLVASTIAAFVLEEKL